MSALDLRRDQCLFSDIGIDEMVDIRKQLRQAFQLPYGQIRLIKQRKQRPYSDRRDGRERRRNKCLGRLASSNRRHVVA